MREQVPLARVNLLLIVCRRLVCMAPAAAMDIRRQVGRNLKRIRKDKGWSQEELAFESGLHRTYISGIERGARNPTIVILARLAGTLSVPVENLVMS